MKPEKLLFIFFDSRSGSTFLAKQLSDYMCACFPPESNFVAKAVQYSRKNEIADTASLAGFLDAICSDPKFRDLKVDRSSIEQKIPLPATLQDLIKGILELYQSRVDPAAELIGIKKNYLKHFARLRELFPHARYMGIIRDGRAVFNSKKTSLYSRTRKPFETNPYKAARAWCRNVDGIYELKSQNEDIAVVYYESFLSNPEKTLELLRLEYDVSLRTKKEEASEYTVPERYGKTLHKNIDQPAIATRINAWQSSLHPSEIKAFESVAWRSLIREGYDLDGRESIYSNLMSRWRIWLEYTLYRFKKAFSRAKHERV